MRPVCVLGLGLIGGSVLRAASAAGSTAWGSAGEDDAAAARADGYPVLDPESALHRAAKEDALVVLAVPLTAVDEVLTMIARHAPECRLSDVASVKLPVADAVRRLVPGARYVGGHPMAGSTTSGWAAGSAELFRGAAWVTTVDDTTDLTVWRDVAELAIESGSYVVPTSCTEHDDAVAKISHLPHVLAAVLAAIGAEGGPLPLSLAAGSFGDGTRVAGTRPELTQAMCEGNRGPLLSALDDALGKLGAARGALASTGSLGATLRSGHAGRAALEEARTAAHTPARIDLTAPDAPEGLRRIGARGGRIITVGPDAAEATLP